MQLACCFGVNRCNQRTTVDTVPVTFLPLSTRTQDVSSLLTKGAPEAAREALALREAAVGLKLEAGRLGRSEMMMRQKVGACMHVRAPAGLL